MTSLALLIGLLSVAAADNAVTASNSYTAPEPEYQAPQYETPQYEAPLQAYVASGPAYSAPAHFETGGYAQDASYAPYISPGGPLNLGTFKGDWIITGLLLAGVVVCLSLIGVITVPFLPFTALALPKLGGLLEGRALADWSLADVADTVNRVELAIERAGKFLRDFKPAK